MYRVYFNKFPVVTIDGNTIVIAADNLIINELDTLVAFCETNIKRKSDFHIYTDDGRREKAKAKYIKLHCDNFMSLHNIKNIRDLITYNSEFITQTNA